MYVLFAILSTVKYSLFATNTLPALKSDTKLVPEPITIGTKSESNESSITSIAIALYVEIGNASNSAFAEETVPRESLRIMYSLMQYILTDKL